jgi:hypothetical protein
VKSSWKKVGLAFEQRNEMISLFVVEVRMRESAEFAELWVIDYAEENSHRAGGSSHGVAK